MTAAPDNQMNPSHAYPLPQLQATLDAIMDGIAVVGLDGRIKAFGKRFQEILGMPEAILKSGDANQVVAFMLGMVAAPDAFFKKWQALAADPEGRSLDTLRLKDGRVLEVYSNPQRLRGEVIGRVWALRDVTEQEWAEKALRASRGLLDTVINGVSTLMAYIDRDGRYLFANQAYAEWHGMRQEEIVGKQVDQVLSPELYQSVSDAIEKALGGQRVSFPNKEIARDGARRYVNANYDPHVDGGEVKGVFASILDVTERKDVEKALEKSEQKLKFILEKLPVLMWQKDRNGTYLQVNRAFFDIYGLPESEIVGKTDSDIFGPRMAARFAATDRRVLDSGSPLLGIEDRLERPSQPSLWIRKDKFPHFDAEGHVDGTIGFGLDITEAKKTEVALRQSEKRLDAKIELEAKNKELEALNTALNYLLEKRKSDEINFKEQVAANMRHLVYPFLEKIESRPLDSQLKALVNAVRFNLEQITDPFSKTFSSVRYGLTPTEIRVADLIRQGEKSKDIAKILGVSFKTVESHRERIRKKFGLAHQKKNLRSFLLSIE